MVNGPGVSAGPWTSYTEAEQVTDVFKVDTQVPLVTRGVDTQARTITVEASDSGSGIATIEYSIDGGATWKSYTDTVKAGDDGVSLGYRVTDKAGLVSASNYESTHGVKITLKRGWVPMGRRSAARPNGSLRSGRERNGREQTMLWSVLSALLVMLLVSGCSLNQTWEKTVVDYRTAKSQTMAKERDVAAVIAPEDILDVKQNQTSSLLGCSDGEHLWTGQIFVTLADGVDGPAYVQLIKDTWSTEEGWTVSQRTGPLGAAVVDISSDESYNHGVDYSEKYHAIRILSFSPCFILDPPYQVGNEY